MPFLLTFRRLRKEITINSKAVWDIQQDFLSLTYTHKYERRGEEGGRRKKKKREKEGESLKSC